ncbi:MAG TPA: hypothetical protein VHP36_10370 [Chitinispirillaceae bacterium]|nr:hypothetical protein [Chitinispirillaceae bacterium]
MKYSDKFAELLKKMQQSSDNSASVENIYSPFWEMIIDAVCEVIRSGKDLDAFLKEEYRIIDFGITPELCSDPQKNVSYITEYNSDSMPVQILTMTVWISNLVCKILKGDKEELLLKKIEMSKIGIRKTEQEIKSQQQERKALLQSLLERAPSGGQYIKFLDLIDEIDKMTLESLRVKKSISNGAFLTVEHKRSHVEREKRLLKESQWYNSLLGVIKERESILEIKKISDRITANFNALLDYEQTIEKSNDEIQKIKKQYQEISPLEIQSKVQKELEKIRDLVRLSSKRCHCECNPLISESSKYLTFKDVGECLDRILEFDPKIFHNDRVTIFGKPQVLLVPGSGNALYDWENNFLIVPLTIQSNTSAMTSIAAGIIEYRLDVDESRILLTTYNQLAENKNIRSSTVIKYQLIKDYITWMTSEYKGYRILKKEIKQWFEHEIAPSKNEIYTPASYQIFNLDKEEYQKQLNESEQKIKEGIESCSDQELWVSSLLFYQKGELSDALRFLECIAARKQALPMVYYNIGQIASKLSMRQVAQDGFTEYIKRNPQSWWAKNAQDRLSRL